MDSVSGAGGAGGRGVDFGRLVRVLIGASMLMFLPVLSGRPTIYPDTRSYYALGQQIAEIAHLAPRGSAAAALGYATTGSGDASGRDLRLAFTIAGARSPTYSTYLYLFDTAGSGWAPAIFQALLASWAIELLAYALGLSGWYLIGVAVLALASSLPIVASFLSPDVFMGVAAVLAIYFLYGRGRGAIERTAAFLALAFCLSTHLTNVLVIGALLAVVWPAAAMLRLPTPSPFRVRALWIGAAVVAALSVGAVYSAGVKLVQHQTLRSPPFLTARLVADGPGRAYLGQACARDPNAYALCAFRDRPMTVSDDILWSFDPRLGVFEIADYDTRVRMISEQNRFVLGVIVHEPAAVLRSSLRDFASQIGMYEVDTSDGDPDAYFQQIKFASFAKILPDAARCAVIRHACAPRLDPQRFDVVILIALIASLAAIAASARAVVGRAPQLMGAAVVTLLIVVLNAAVCGVLSEPSDRYQNRIAWLIELIAVWMVLVWSTPVALRARRLESHAPIV